MDLVLKLRELRRLRGLSQKEVARRSKIHEKTISALETGTRIDSLKLTQLRRLLKVYGLTEVEFFSGAVEREAAPWEVSVDEAAALDVVEKLKGLPPHVRASMLHRFHAMLVETGYVSQENMQ